MSDAKLELAKAYMEKYPDTSRRTLSQRIHVSQNTIRQWVNEGKLEFNDEAINEQKRLWKR